MVSIPDLTCLSEMTVWCFALSRDPENESCSFCESCLLVRIAIPIGKHSGSHMAHKCMTPSTHIFTMEDQGACWKECSFHSQRN